MSTILAQKLYRLVPHQLQLQGRKVDFIENQHYFDKPLVLIGGFVRCSEGDDLPRHAVVQEREIPCRKPRNGFPLAVHCGDIEMDEALRRLVGSHDGWFRRHNGLHRR